MKTFPDLPAYSGYDEPVRIEADVYDLPVTGEVPADLVGNWYRVGPDTQYPPFLGHDIYINGDGMVTMFRIENGCVDFRSRYVRTERWKAERAARRSLYGKYRVPVTDDPSVQGRSRGTANTTPLFQGGKLLILKEDHVPIEIDPDTLETRGSYTWDGRLRSRTATAHPKTDPVTGECVMMGYECEGDGSAQVAWWTVDRDGNIGPEEWFTPPYISMIHDFAITQDYVLFPVMPVVMDPARLAAGGDHWMWDGSRPSWMGIMKRIEGVRSLRWCRMPTCFAFHTINAFNEGSRVTIDMVASRRCAFPFIDAVDGSQPEMMDGVPFPTRWCFDLENPAEDAGFQETRLSLLPAELPLIDTRRTGRRHRYAYVAMTDPSHRMLKAGPAMMAANAVGKLDLDGGPPQVWYGAEETSFQEGFFIPRGEAEDDGWYINIADHHDRWRSDLLIFDAQQIDRGPVATVHMPLRLRNAFHTLWVPQSARRKVG
ncbi:carotenoid oxygenase family protein [Novosphingobium sp.]|uniref:carotenoid oxygenase family protein n=1 Tax=Novosphingobium sp. TaxID=1874826 RepID=UPI00262E6A21|nr:carotenoid oxygenase family protein [Novosphingobium sp.]